MQLAKLLFEPTEWKVASMTDWADEIALKLAPDDEFTWPEEAIAAALRKAKADGMREGARLVFSAHSQKEILLRASAIEKGTE